MMPPAPVLVMSLAATLVGCTATRVNSPSKTGGTRSPPDAGANSKTTCPDTWRAAHHARCERNRGSRCEYAEAVCVCQLVPYCGGPAPPPDHLRPVRLECRSRVATKPLEDDKGCPLHPPGRDLSCRHEGQVCRYESCSYIDTRSTCKGGRWITEQRMVGPPPA